MTLGIRSGTYSTCAPPNIPCVDSHSAKGLQNNVLVRICKACKVAGKGAARSAGKSGQCSLRGTAEFHVPPFHFFETGESQKNAPSNMVDIDNSNYSWPSSDKQKDGNKALPRVWNPTIASVPSPPNLLCKMCDSSRSRMHILFTNLLRTVATKKTNEARINVYPIVCVSVFGTSPSSQLCNEQLLNAKAHGSEL